MKGSAAVPVSEDPFAGIPRTKTLAQAAALWATSQALQQVVAKARSQWRERLAYTVTLRESDPMYADVHEWVLSLLPSSAQRALAVTSGSPSGDTTPEGGGAPSRLRLTHDSSRPRRIVVGQHTVTVEVNRPDASSDSSYRPAETIQFTCSTRAAQEAVLDELGRIIDSRAKRRPVLRTVSRWGGWQRHADVPPRSWRSVAVDQAQKDRLEHDLDVFLNAEDAYSTRGIPWHRGYLLHGPPGTGKTSLAKALANRFGLDVWSLSLSDLEQDASLMNLLAEVSPRSMLLIEDVDTLAAARDRDADGRQVSTAALLNALDGVATPHGLITVMTTNRIETLDPALTRAGRMDVVELIDYPTTQEISDLFFVYFGHHPSVLPTDAIGTVSQADIAEVLKGHLDDSTAALRALRALLAKNPQGDGHGAGAPATVQVPSDALATLRRARELGAARAVPGVRTSDLDAFLAAIDNEHPEEITT